MMKRVMTYMPWLAGLTVFALWQWQWPHLSTAREGMQLFLWNGAYLAERMLLPAGMMQYAAEWLVQFFVNPLYAALILSLTFLLVQWLTARLLSVRLWVLSFVPAVVLCWLWTNLQVPLTLTVAVVLVLTVANVLQPLPRRWYWLLLAVVVFWAVRPAFYTDAYYWQRQQVGSHEEMKYDLLLRQQRWGDMASIFRQSPTADKAVRNAALLAQWHEGQLSEQQLLQELTLSNRTLLGVSSAWLMSEVCMQIGMVSIAQRAAFEAMESVPNGNKSARALRRLVETNIITGQYAVALKYISILEETLFYRRWARQMRPLAEHPGRISQYPGYEKLKEVFDHGKDRFFY